LPTEYNTTRTKEITVSNIWSERYNFTFNICRSVHDRNVHQKCYRGFLNYAVIQCKDMQCAMHVLPMPDLKTPTLF
jgi:hypothetical protein